MRGVPEMNVKLFYRNLAAIFLNFTHTIINAANNPIWAICCLKAHVEEKLISKNNPNI